MGLRLLGLTQGAIADPMAASGLNINVFSACTRHMTVTDVLDISLRGWARYQTALVNWSPDRDIWRERFDLNMWSFRNLSRKAGQELVRRRGSFDVVLQLRALFAPGLPPKPWPYTVLVDNTYALSDRYYRPWAPMSVEERNQWLEIERDTYHRAAFVFARTHWVRRSLIEDYGMSPDRAIWVGTGSHFQADSKPKSERAGSEKIILFVGKEIRRKGIEVLLKAFEQVRSRVPEARLLVIGRKMHVNQDGVEAVGKISDRKQMHRVYERASVFVLPALFEPCGNVVAEAMAHQLPCIVSNAGGLAEFVEDGRNGYIVPPGNVDLLAEKLVEVLQDDQKRTEMGERSLELVCEKFNWNAVIERMLPYLEQAAGMEHFDG